MKYKINKHPSRTLPTIERGFRDEVKALRQRDSTLSVYEASLRVIESFESEVVLTKDDREWLDKKRGALLSDKYIARKRTTLTELFQSSKGDTGLESLLQEAIEQERRDYRKRR
jgi:hypothetical protein